MRDLLPSVGALARLAQEARPQADAPSAAPQNLGLRGGPRNDALEGVDLGEGTFLNSREFKYASFFNRLHRSVSLQWHPMREYQAHDPLGNVYGYGTRVTTVQVSLDASGALQAVSVQRSCGLTFLDDEAVAAFQRAAPFPHPPTGLLDSTGHISFSFGFHLEVH